QLSACLAVAHGLGIRHLGLRPSKVLLGAAPAGNANDGEQVKLLDLGLLDALGTQTRASRPEALQPAQQAYLAPEQRRGAAVQGGQADVFALGVILYEMASGSLPAVALVNAPASEAPGGSAAVLANAVASTIEPPRP